MNLDDELIPFSINQQKAISMLINAEYYHDAINIKIDNLSFTSQGIMITNQDQSMHQLFSKEEFRYLIKQTQHPTSLLSHTNIDFDNQGNLIYYINEHECELLFDNGQVKMIKLLCQYFNRHR